MPPSWEQPDVQRRGPSIPNFAPLLVLPADETAYRLGAKFAIGVTLLADSGVGAPSLTALRRMYSTPWLFDERGCVGFNADPHAVALLERAEGRQRWAVRRVARIFARRELNWLRHDLQAVLPRVKYLELHTPPRVGALQLSIGRWKSWA